MIINSSFYFEKCFQETLRLIGGKNQKHCLAGKLLQTYIMNNLLYLHLNLPNFVIELHPSLIQNSILTNLQTILLASSQQGGSE